MARDFSRNLILAKFSENKVYQISTRLCKLLRVYKTLSCWTQLSIKKTWWLDRNWIAFTNKITKITRIWGKQSVKHFLKCIWQIFFICLIESKWHPDMNIKNYFSISIFLPALLLFKNVKFYFRSCQKPRKGRPGDSHVVTSFQERS